MPKRITELQRQTILRMLGEGQDRDTIALTVGVTPGQVSAISAHVKMGTYRIESPQQAASGASSPMPATERTANLLNHLRNLKARPIGLTQFRPILLGTDEENKEKIFWNPDPQTGSANPHVLVLGESGFGKTYTVSCLLGELAQRNILSVVFDYGQGFSVEAGPKEFLDWVKPIEIHASRDGIDINPLQIFPTDIHGPINVAQRLADTFARVYPKIGVQQHAVLRQTILDVMAEQGIHPGDPSSWQKDLPAFSTIQQKLESYAENPKNPQSKVAASLASHISTVFVFNTFRSNGQRLAWSEMLSSNNRVFIVQLKGLEFSLERAVTELLLWNFIGFVEAMGPSHLQCFVVLDEAHKLSFDRGSPVEKLLREGRKFGLGLILASQQPEDFSPVAFANTATKVVFQVGDERSSISRQLHRKVRGSRSFVDISELITKLPRGWAYVVSENIGHVVQITDLSTRIGAPKQ